VIKVHHSTVADYVNGTHNIPEPVPDPTPRDSEAFTKLIASLRRNTLCLEDISDKLECPPKRARELIAEARDRGHLIAESNDVYSLQDAVTIEPAKAEHKASHRITRIGVLGDNHLCNKHSRLDVLNAAYDRYAAEGIIRVYNTGNMIDGEARFNRMELVTRPGLEAQCEYAANEYPVRSGIETKFICGDDHEGWYQQREVIEVGRYMQHYFEDAGRTDMEYIGYGECDVKLIQPGGSAVMRVVHPGGGSAYAHSYAIQKLVESYQGGEKPHVLLAGHYHKFEQLYPRGICAVQTACTCDQTLFLRKNKIDVHLGYLIVNIEQEDNGAISRFGVEFFPYYDRAYYKQRF
jgi:hypothetical protein